MKLPDPSENLYPKTEENLRAIVERYFRQSSNKDKEESIQKWLGDNYFTLNQIEFGAQFVSENDDLLKEAEFSTLPSARVHYALMSIFLPKEEWRTSGANMKRLEHFRQLYRDSFFEEWPGNRPHLRVPALK